MARIEKTVFISYRRTDLPWALLVYQNLTAKNFDVFFDYTALSAGDFEQVIISNIKARAHFLVILTPAALDRCDEPRDWLRREIETAIIEKRNIIPLFFDNFSFETPSVSKKLTGKLAMIKKYNGLEVPGSFFYEAMERLRNRYLNVALETVLHPISDEIQKVVQEQQVAADKAVLQRNQEESKARKLFGDAQRAELLVELEKALNLYYEVKWIDPLYPRIDTKIDELENELRKNREERERKASEVLARKAAEEKARKDEREQKRKKLSDRIYISIVQPLVKLRSRFLWLTIFVILISMIVLFGKFILNGEIPLFLTSTTTLVSTKDNMTIVYIPAGEFPMGSNDGDNDEEPVHTIYLDNFWIDQTEITNALYKECVQANECNIPSSKEFFDDINYNDHPVVYVSWNDASAYCAWAGRRLPTEAEWEKAASWVEKTRSKYIYPWGNTFVGTRVNYCDKNCVFGWADKTVNDRFAGTAPVGSYRSGASPYGVYDMAGNVWEWVADWYSETYYSNSPPTYPLGPDSGDYRVLRGGAWLNLSSYIRSSDRNRSDPRHATYDFGFRCAIGASP